jgi:coenzyme F420 hydrogenase subunit beta
MAKPLTSSKVGSDTTWETIEKVVLDELCTGCGTCIGICPLSAIEMTKDERKGIYLPKVDDSCNECGLCLEVCPGHAVDFKELNADVFGRQIEDRLIGNYINSYVGHSRNEDIRFNSGSGGVITALLGFALDEGIIDGALVTKMCDGNPLQPEAFIARTSEEIAAAAGSKYCPVAANTALEQILKANGEYAVVGLPCHIHGVRKAEMRSRKLKERVILHLGVFCSHTTNILGTEFFLEKLNVPKSDVARLAYRGQGWPGMMTIELRTGATKLVPYLEYAKSIHNSNLFSPTRCLLCADGSAEFADISFGDPWLPEFRDEKVGSSLVITRSNKGEQILWQAEQKGVVHLTPIATTQAVRAQRGLIYTKKVGLGPRIKLWKMLGKKVPLYNTEFPKGGFLLFPDAMLPLLNTLVLTTRVRALLKYIPLRVLRYYAMACSVVGHFWFPSWLRTGACPINPSFDAGEGNG